MSLLLALAVTSHSQTSAGREKAQLLPRDSPTLSRQHNINPLSLRNQGVPLLHYLHLHNLSSSAQHHIEIEDIRGCRDLEGYQFQLEIFDSCHLSVRVGQDKDSSGVICFFLSDKIGNIRENLQILVVDPIFSVKKNLVHPPRKNFRNILHMSSLQYFLCRPSLRLEN